MINKILLILFLSSFQVNAKIIIKAPKKIKQHLANWLNQIKSYQTGKEMIRAINKCGHEVTIEHSKSARISAGQTGAPATRNLTNGVGENVYIKIDGTIPFKGSHYTYDMDGERLEFNAVVNLFHELSHARHMSCGTWLYADSEGQAVRDENKLRTEQYTLGEVDHLNLRYDITGCSYDEDEQECLEFFEDDD